MSDVLKSRLDTLERQKNSEFQMLETRQNSVKHLEALVKELEKFVKEIEQIEVSYSGKHYELVNTQDALLEFFERIRQQVTDENNLSADDRQAVEDKEASVDNQIQQINDALGSLSPKKGAKEQALADAEEALATTKAEFDGWRRPDKYIGDQQQEAAAVRDKIRVARDEGNWKLAYYHFRGFKKAVEGIGYKDKSGTSSGIDPIPSPTQLCKALEKSWDDLSAARDLVRSKKSDFENDKDDLNTVRQKYDEALASREENIIKHFS